MNNTPTQLPTIIKSSGEREEFNLVKFRHSLDKSGLTPEEQDKLINIIKKKHFKSTKELFAFTRSYLHKKNPVLSSRYSLKKALFELGPAGFPFEQFVAALFKEKEYEIETDVILSGWCIDHEIDVVAKKDRQIEIIECKFHGNTLLKTNVKVTLYIKARFDDIFKKLTQDQTVTLPQRYAPWLISNTRFTSNAIAYARCADLELLGWSFPPNNGLQQWIEAAHLHPITALSFLNASTKKMFIQKGLVLCRDFHKHTKLLRAAGFSPQKITTLVKEAHQVCKLIPMAH